MHGDALKVPTAEDKLNQHETSMSDSDKPAELHTEADDLQPLTSNEAVYMGNQVDKKIPGVPASAMLVYGDVDEGSENEDQYDAHHAEQDEHF